MVAFSGPDAIGVLIGAKRPSGTLIHKIAVHPDHLRQGHGRHLLASLGSKLAILGPPRESSPKFPGVSPACELFSACGYVQEALLTDYVLERPALSERGDAARVEGFIMLLSTVDNLAANGLLGPASPSASAGQVNPQVCWERSVETLTARKDDIAGLAIASDERIEAYVLYVNGGGDGDFVAPLFHRRRWSLRVEATALSTPRARRGDRLVPEGPPGRDLEGAGGDARVRPAGGHRLYARRAQSA